MTPRDLPDVWAAVLGPRGAAADGLWDAWDAAGGIEPAELRACARWCGLRADELERSASVGRRLAGEAAQVLGDATAAGGPGPVAADPGPLDAGGAMLRAVAEVLEAGAGAVETVRAQHVGALDEALGDGDAALLDDAGAEAVRAEFGRSCTQTGTAMHRLAGEMAAALDECAAALGRGSGGGQGAVHV